jgi:hypothetical protein
MHWKFWTLNNFVGAASCRELAGRLAHGSRQDADPMLRQTVDPDSALRVTDFDGATSGPVQFVDGAPVSGLSYTFTTLGDTIGDDVGFSWDNGANWDYVPVAGTDGSDPLVTDIRISSQGTLNGNSGSGEPAVNFVFKTVMQ